MQHGSTLPVLPSTAHLPCLGRNSRKGRVWWHCQNIFFITDQENVTWSDYGEEFNFMCGFSFSNGYSTDWGLLTHQEKNKIFRMRKTIWLGTVANKRLFFFPYLLRHLQVFKTLFYNQGQETSNLKVHKTQCTRCWRKLWKQTHQQLSNKMHLKLTFNGIKLLFTKRIWQ